MRRRFCPTAKFLLDCFAPQLTLAQQPCSNALGPPQQGPGNNAHLTEQTCRVEPALPDIIGPILAIFAPGAKPAHR